MVLVNTGGRALCERVVVSKLRGCWLILARGCNGASGLGFGDGLSECAFSGLACSFSIAHG